MEFKEATNMDHLATEKLVEYAELCGCDYGVFIGMGPNAHGPKDMHTRLQTVRTKDDPATEIKALLIGSLIEEIVPQLIQAVGGHFEEGSEQIVPVFRRERKPDGPAPN